MGAHIMGKMVTATYTHEMAQGFNGGHAGVQES